MPLAVTFGRECYDTSAESTYSGKYPVARFLYIYFNKKPNEPIDPLRREFIKYVLSKDGQMLTEKVDSIRSPTNSVKKNSRSWDF